MNGKHVLVFLAAVSLCALLSICYFRLWEQADTVIVKTGSPGGDRQATSKSAPLEPPVYKFPREPAESPRVVLPKIEDVFVHSLARTLASAAQRGDTDVLKKLIAKGADVNAQGIDGASVLMWAILADSFDGSEVLLDAGADPNLQDDLGNSPLLLAATRADSRLVKALLVNGANVDIRERRGTTPLMIASLLGQTKTVKLLIHAKAGVNATDASGRSALHYAVIRARTGAITLLLDGGANADLKDEMGLTPADIAPADSSGVLK